MNVAVIGVKGIGKHHAKWWQLEGANVCAFLGSSPETVTSAQEMLTKHLDADVPGFFDLNEMLTAEKPDIVDVCSPPGLHAEHCEAALNANCHVLCEKPFVYEEGVSSDKLLRHATSLVQLAQRKERRLGLCLQYVESARSLLRLWGDIRPNERIERMEGVLASPAKGRAPDPRRVWVDLAPHPLSALHTVFRGRQPDWSSLRTDFHDYQANATFVMRDGNEYTVQCTVRTYNTQNPPANVRRFVLNDIQFDIEGYKDDDGVFQARIHWTDGSLETEDAMRMVLRRFIEGEPSTCGEEGVRNLEWLLEILETAS